HSRTAILINDLIDSLLERNTVGATERLQLLRTEAGSHPALQSLEILTDALERWPVPATAAAHSARLIEWLDSEVERAASRAFGTSAQDFMRPFWRDLAQALARQPYDPKNPRAHSAYCCLRAGEARAALESFSAIKGHDPGDPFLLQWETIARYRAFGWRAARGSFFTLALRAPEHLIETLIEMGDSALLADWERFWLECAWLEPRDVIGASWFPAWYLIEHPATRLEELQTLGDLDSSPVRAFQVIRRLQALDPFGHGPALISTRAELRRIDEQMFRHYMSRPHAT
ncbi:MAG TPA: hypothetical protein VE820_07240, partial [Sphingomicrobium sp.]|nr:hypothetical protein [Sphingomicrobium sp.]